MDRITIVRDERYEQHLHVGNLSARQSALLQAILQGTPGTNIAIEFVSGSGLTVKNRKLGISASQFVGMVAVAAYFSNTPEDYGIGSSQYPFRFSQMIREYVDLNEKEIDLSKAQDILGHYEKTVLSKSTHRPH
jgi:hypothetical protein